MESKKTCGSFKQTSIIFGKHFVIIGLIGGLIATTIECKEKYSGIAGFVYGIIPITFIYLYAVSMKYHGVETCDEMTKTTIIGGFLWLLYIIFVLLSSMYISKNFCRDATKSCKVKKSCFNLLIPLVVSTIFIVITVLIIKKINPSLLWYDEPTEKRV